MSAQRPDRDTLMAYVDGQIDPARRADVEAWIAHDAQTAAQIQALRAQNQSLRDALAPMLDEPVPARLLRRPPGAASRPWLRAASVALWLGVGAAAGSLATRGLQEGGPSVVAQGEGIQHFVRQAELAYAVYTPDARRPVEVRDGSDLVAWLSRRLQRPLVAPEALPGGLVLMGGRLLPGVSGKPAAQLMYQDAQGRRVTVYLRAMPGSAGETAFRITRSKGATTFYWVDRDWGYALTGDLPRDRLLDAARALYRRYAADPQPAPAAPVGPRL